MLSNFDLIQLCQTYRVPLAGIYLRDKLSRQGPAPGLSVVNLDDGDKGGTHWTALWHDGTHSVYFDSFGAVPPVEVIKWAKPSATGGLQYSAWIVQNIKSEACGFYCLAFGLCIQRERGPAETLKDCANRFVNMFQDDSLKNDGHLKRYLESVHKIPPAFRAKLK